MNEKQKEFCHKLIECGFNQTEAYHQLYGGKRASNRKEASKLLTKPDIKKYLSEVMEKYRQHQDLTVGRMIDTILKDKDYAMVANQYGPVMKANELLGRHLGMFQDNLKVDANVNISNLSREDLEKLRKDD